MTCTTAAAWGEKGHQVTALIAYRHLTLSARSALDRLLASDSDSLTPPDLAGRSVWADRYRDSHRETSAWHFVNIEIDAPDLDAACFNFPALASDQPASHGPAQDCIVNKVEQFSAELKNPRTAPDERLLALKFLVHFIGDLHQPLHVIDHLDRGGNCVRLSPPLDEGPSNLHAYWDIVAVNGLGESAPSIAARLDAEITPAERLAWSAGSVRAWTLEAFELGKRDVYRLASAPTCRQPGTVGLPTEYRQRAVEDAGLQLKKAAIRLAAVLNAALG